MPLTVMVVDILAQTVNFRHGMIPVFKELFPFERQGRKMHQTRFAERININYELKLFKIYFDFQIKSLHQTASLYTFHKLFLQKSEHY